VAAKAGEATIAPIMVGTMKVSVTFQRAIAARKSAGSKAARVTTVPPMPSTHSALTSPETWKVGSTLRCTVSTPLKPNGPVQSVMWVSTP